MAITSFTLSSLLQPSTSSISSSCSSYFLGGVHLRSHESFISVHSLYSTSKSEVPSRRLRTVAVASGDFYSALGVPKSATSKEIKAAYRRLARQYHPDVNKEPGATEKFKEISAAYEMIKRGLYMINMERLELTAQ